MTCQRPPQLPACLRPLLNNLASVAILLGVLAFAAPSARAHRPTSSQIAQIKSAVVVVTTYDDGGKPLLQGSGFFIDLAQVVTSLHVIKGASQIRVETFTGTTATVQSVDATNETADLALLRIAQPCSNCAILPLAAATVEGEAITMVSNPRGSRWRVSRGSVGTLWEFGGVGTLLQVTAAIRPGSSGGPVVNLQGQVIGIASLHIDSADNLNFAVPVESLRDLQTQARLKAKPTTVQQN